MNRFGIIALFIVVTACGLLSCRKPEQKATTTEGTNQTNPSPATSPSLQASAPASDASSRIVVAAGISGPVSEIRVREGERVLRGTVIATIDLPTAESRIVQAKQKLNESEIQLEIARTNYLSARQRAETGQLDKTLLDRLQGQWNSAIERRNEALNALTQEDRQREKCYLRAPRDGEVVSVTASSNAPVTAGQAVIVIQ